MIACTAAVWANVATTPVSLIPARMALHARSRRQRCSTASAAKDFGVRRQQKESFSTAAVQFSSAPNGHTGIAGQSWNFQRFIPVQGNT